MGNSTAAASDDAARPSIITAIPAQAELDGRRRTRRLRWLAVVVALLAVVIAVGIVNRPTSAARPQPAAEVGPAAVTASPTPSTWAPDGPSVRPVTLRIPSLAVTAKVEAVGTDEKLQMDIPEDPSLLGWWRSGAEPGEARGNSVIAGHVYSSGWGYGALSKLDTLEPGDTVTVSGSGSRSIEYRVVSKQLPKKVDLAAMHVFDADGPHQLVLITCGGYNEETDHYERNVVVFAEPL